MCLYLRYKEECVATSNICVWKALINYGRLGYYSPIFNYRYNIGETYTSYLDRNKNSVSVDIGLHSFGYNIKIVSLMLEDMNVVEIHIIVLILMNLLIL
jgi:hypothetical protein